jgi:hypothetical protein
MLGKKLDSRKIKPPALAFQSPYDFRLFDKWFENLDMVNKNARTTIELTNNKTLDTGNTG